MPSISDFGIRAVFVAVLRPDSLAVRSGISLAVGTAYAAC